MSKTNKILFIEDETALQKTFDSFLTKQGFEMLSALDGEIGLRLAKTKKPDLILLDLILPKIDGFELLKKIKADPDIKDIPIIVLTNLESLSDINRALEAGATTYLVKSDFNLDEILEKIKQSLAKAN